MPTAAVEASKVLAQARLGTDVAAQKRAAAGKVTVTLGELVTKYLDERQPKLRPRYFTEIKRQLEKDWKPLHGMAVDAITRQNVVDRVGDIATGQGEVAADRARMALSGFYAWAIDRGYCEANPTMNIKARAQNTGRSRVLSEPELVEVWRACLDDDYGRIIRLLILTAQRKTEIGDLMWVEIDSDKREIELPASHPPSFILTRLFRKKSEKGNTYFTGRLGGARVVLLKSNDTAAGGDPPIPEEQEHLAASDERTLAAEDIQRLAHFREV